LTALNWLAVLGLTRIFQVSGMIGRSASTQRLYGVVGIGRGGFQQVADAPGDSDPVAQPAAVAAATGAEHSRDILGLGGFFTEVQLHAQPIRSPLNGKQDGQKRELINLYMDGYTAICVNNAG
jgi:hypothetical protein